jgi:hypothetical protein
MMNIAGPTASLPMAAGTPFAAMPGATMQPGMSAMVTPSMAMGAPAGYSQVGVAPMGAMNPYGPMGMLPQNAAASQALLGATVGNPPSTIGSILKNALVFGALGAGAGAGIGMIPFLPGGPLTGALVGGVAGALFGAFKGFRSAKRAQEEFRIMTQNMQAQTTAPEVPVHVANVGPKKHKKPKRTHKVGKKPKGEHAGHNHSLKGVHKHESASVHAAHKTAKKAHKPSLAVNNL